MMKSSSEASPVMCRIINKPATPEAIASLMADGRERTVNDVALRLRISTDMARHYLARLVRDGRLVSRRHMSAGVDLTIWRKA